MDTSLSRQSSGGVSTFRAVSIPHPKIFFLVIQAAPPLWSFQGYGIFICDVPPVVGTEEFVDSNK